MAKKRTKIGFNPLAWMKAGTDDVPVVAPVPAAPVAKAEPAPTIEAAPKAEAAPKKEPPAAPASSAPAEIGLDGGEALDLAHAAKLHAEFKQALAHKKPLRLNLSRLQAADTAGIQLLLALRRAAERSGVACVWESPAREVCAVASQLGLSDALGLPSQEAAR